MKKCILAISILLICAVKVSAQKPVKFIPEKVVQGEKIKIEYDSRKSNLFDNKEIKGTIYTWENYIWKADDLIMKHQDSVWTTNYIVPENAALIVLTFNAGGSIDKGGKETYCQFLVGRNGKAMPSAYVGWALLRNESLKEYNIPGFCDTTNAIDNSVVLFWLNQELKYNPEERGNIIGIGIKVLQKSNTEEQKMIKIAESDVNYILSKPNPTQKQLLDAREECDEILKNNELKAKIDSSLYYHYPKNLLKRDSLIKKGFRETSFDLKEKIVDEIVQDYPQEIYKQFRSDTYDMYMGKTFQSIIYNKIAKEGDFSKMDKYLKNVPRELIVTFYWHHVQLAFRDKTRGADKLLELSTKLLNELESRPRENSELSISPSRWSEMFYPKRKDILLTHSELLLANNQKEEAFEIAEKIKPFFENKSTDFNDLYVRILNANNYQNLVTPFIKESVEKNAATPEMLQILKQDYLKLKGSDSGFEEYLSSLKSPADSKKMHEEILKSLIKEKIDLYSLESMNGGVVDMSLLKGKIIVIDFWATWCAPCKAALPGMQLAVNKYKSDPGVRFFFIATQEYKPGFKNEIRKFIKEKGYNLDVLFDNPDASGKAQAVYSKYASKFKFSGIPQKLIIDGNGFLRWSSTGYYGSPTKLADEISYIIEYLKKEK